MYADPLGLLSCSSCASAPTLAQSSSIGGRVVDPQGASVAGAEITAHDVWLPTGAWRSLPADGSFRFDDVTPGQYVLLVRAPGFADWTQSTSAGSAPQAIVVTMQVAGVTEDVTVQGALLGTAATGKTNLPLRELPMTIQAVPRHVIEEQGANDLPARCRMSPASTRSPTTASTRATRSAGFSICSRRLPTSSWTACGTKATASTPS